MYHNRKFKTKIKIALGEGSYQKLMIYETFKRQKYTYLRK